MLLKWPEVYNQIIIKPHLLYGCSKNSLDQAIEDI